MSQINFFLHEIFPNLIEGILPNQLAMEVLQLIITVLSVILFLRIYWIQAGSNSLVGMMNMQKKEILNEIEFGIHAPELDRKSILEAMSYLNLVSKLYLNNSINVNMLRTFEGVMIKLLEVEVTQKIYKEIYFDFKDSIKTAEPPYINLIYATHMLINLNRILNHRSFYSPAHAWFYKIYKKLYFSFRPFSRKNWQLAARVFEKGSL